MPVLGAATLELNADGAKLEQDLGRAVQSATTFGTAIGTALGQALSAAGQKLQAMVTQAIDTGDELNKLSQKTGMSVENLSELRVAAQLADVSMNTLKAGVKGLYETLSQAGRGSDKKNSAFEAIGLDVEKLRAMKPDEMFRTVTEQLAKYEDGANRAAIQTAILGKAGAELSPFINELGKTTAIARELGITMDKNTAAAAERFKDNLAIGRIASEAMGMRIAQVLLPSLEKLSGFLVENAKNTERLDTVTKAADTGLKLMATGVSVAGAAFEIAGGHIGRMAAVFGAVVRGDFKAAAGIAKDTIADVGTVLGETAGKIHNIWEETGNKVAADAEKNAKKLAEPMEKAAKKVKEHIRDLDKDARDLSAAWAKLFMSGTASDEEQIATRVLAPIGDELERIQKNAIETHAAYAQALQRMREGTLGDDENVATRIGEVGQKIKQTNDFARDMGLTFESAFEKAAAGGEKLSVVFKGLLQDIGKIVMRKTVTEPLGNAISGLFKDFDFGKIFGARADGGPVTGGQPYIVGERGPELFVPGASGAIVPNGAMGGATNTFYVDNRGASLEAVAKLERIVLQVNGSIEQRALGVVRAARSRGMG